MELVVMALILTAVLVGQYFIYDRLGQKKLSYTLTVRKRGTEGSAAGSSDQVV